MLRPATLKSTACIAALLTATGAMADVTAGDIWADTLEAMEGYGENSLTYSIDDSTAGTIIINDLKMDLDMAAMVEASAGESADVDMEVARMQADLGQIVFEEQGDGTVKIAFTETVPIRLIGEDGQLMSMTATQRNLVVYASGEPERTNYTLSADSYGLTIDDINDPEFDGQLDVRISANGVIGNYVLTDGAAMGVEYNVDIQSMDFLMDVNDPSTDTVVLFSGKLNDMSTTANMTIPEGESLGSPTLMMADGFAMDAGYGFGSGQILFDVTDAGEIVQGSASMGAGEVDVAMTDGGVRYGGSTKDLNVDVNAPDLPFPVNVQLAEYGFGLSMPMATSEEPQDLGLLINLQELSVNDEIWMMADPMGALPHDPVTITVDLLGKAKLFVDLMDVEQMARLNGVPGELYSMDLRNLTVKAAGAEITGDGAFTFDNTDLESFDGLPKPTGEVTVNINGANKLIDTLVSMGLLPEDQAMMGRMMMGMFARTVGDDQLTSTLEINDQGHILANGQRIQ